MNTVSRCKRLHKQIITHLYLARQARAFLRQSFFEGALENDMVSPPFVGCYKLTQDGELRKFRSSGWQCWEYFFHAYWGRTLTDCHQN
jgi:hypothetical protein